ncbi:DUF924 family protein [soil metagenome]
MIDARDPKHAQDVLDFWFGAPDSIDFGKPRKAWFRKSPAFDDEIRQRFGELHRAFVAEPLLDIDPSWIATAERIVATIVVLDQFSRNLARHTPRAYALDRRALSSADELVASGRDRELPLVMRQFVYLPFEHCEDLQIQQRSLRLFERLALDGLDEPLEFARRHRDVIERFGRFPHRNAVLGRPSTADEVEFLARPGSRF